MATAAIPGMFERGANPLWGGSVPRGASFPVRLPVQQPWGAKPSDRQNGPERTKMQEMRGPEAQSSLKPEIAPKSQTQSQVDRSEAQAEQQRLAELAARCLAGDAVAWEQLAKSQHRRIYGICYRFTGNPTEAEDLTQEAFLKMFKNLDNFDSAKGGFTTWLTTLTRNLLVDNYRRTRMDRVSDSLDESLDSEGEGGGATKADRLMDSGRSQEQHVSGLELRAQIQEALKQVSPELREAVILRDLEDMDYKEIAEVLGVPQGTVKSRIIRGRSELARLLKRIEGQVM